MTRDDVRAAVIAAIEQVAPEADTAHLAPAAPLREQLELDSFDALQILVAIHARVGVDIPERDAGRLHSVDDLVDYVMRKLPEERAVR
jgi:acyl carrier protein